MTTTPSLPLAPAAGDEATIGAMVARDYRTAAVFGRFGLDFCCGGGRTIADACSRKHLDPAVVQAALDALDASPADNSTDRTGWTVEQLIEHIVEVHHQYVREHLPALAQHLGKVARVHGERNPETVALAEQFGTLAAELMEHMEEEERTLFPDLLHLAPTNRAMIEEMTAEHEKAGGGMEAIRSLTDGYRAPEHACATWRVAYQELEAFERDLHLHIHLENTLLFPKALQRV